MKAPNNKELPIRSLSVFAAALLLPCAIAAHASDITYTIDQNDAGTTAKGTVTTNGAVGALTTSDIESFSITLSNKSGSASFDSTDGAVQVSGDAFTATASGLFFDFGSAAIGSLAFQNTTSTDFFCDAGGSACGTAHNAVGHGVLIEFDGQEFTSSGLSATEQIGTMQSTSTSATPEPSSLAMLGTGMLGLAGVVRRRLRR